ncbi:MAG TPA: TrmH family RNA methyltransferase [Trueperaceae bacterium]
MQLKRYKKDADYSYSFGVFPTLELFAHRPERLLRVVAHSKGDISSGIGKIEELCGQHHVPFEVNDRTVEKLSHKGNVYVFAVFEKYFSSLSAERNHLMLVHPADMGNLGTTMRTMLGFGLRDLALVSPAADIFHPHAVRASMGAVFALNAAYWQDVEDYRQVFAHRLYPFMLDADRKLPDAVFEPPFTLVFGPEGPGLDSRFRSLGPSVVIPQGPLVESLNLSVAIGIALYEATRGKV